MKVTLTPENMNEIKEKFGTDTTPVTVRGKTLQLVQVRDIDRLIETQFAQEDPVSGFPFWTRIWEASIILADLLAQVKPDGNREILEIGAGLGVAGLFAAAFGHRVTVTDYDQDALTFAMLSAQLNQLSNVEFQTLDWCAPTLYKSYDYIIGSEVLFNAKLFLPLYGLLKKALAPGGIVYFAHDRNRMSPGQFFELVQKDFKIECKPRVMRADDEEFHIILHRLKRR